MNSTMLRAMPALKLATGTVVAATVLVIANACSEMSRPLAPRAASRSVGAAATGTYYGTTVPVGPGIARTYVKIESGAPVEVGIEMNKGALEGLPTDGGHDGHNDMEHRKEDMFELPLPAEAGATAYKSVNLGWMPFGHPGGAYARPHFDFHFYVIPTADRLAIDRADPQFAQKAASLPAPDFWPTRYYPLSILINQPPAALTVPGMGLHWLDVASPELHGAEFTNTFFYGSWNGAIIFDEPMITKALLESRTSVDVDLPPAAKYSTTGFRAHGYRVYFDEASQRHRVALVKLALTD
jgi:hypothetical protein